MNRKARGAFTLIEMMVAITILSIMMLYLYKSHASLHLSNDFYKEETLHIKEAKLKQKIFFLDFSLLLFGEYEIIQQDIKKDTVFMQTSNSLHKRINPYVAYVVQDSRLYRLESNKKFTQELIESRYAFDIDDFGEVESFKVYKNRKIDENKEDKKLFLIESDFIKHDDILLLVHSLNEI